MNSCLSPRARCRVLSKSDRHTIFVTSSVASLDSLVCEVVTLVALDDLDDKTSNRLGIPNVKRQCIPVERIFPMLREHYRMPESFFWKFHDLVKPYLKNKEKTSRGSTPNGDIST